MPRGKIAEQGVDQEWQVGPPLPQRRQAEGQDLQAEIEVAAKKVGAHPLDQVDRCQTHKPDIHRTFPAAERRIPTLRQEPQQFGLRR